MARQLWLLRHADAEPHGARLDAERRLTERGELQALLAGQALARMGVAFEVMFTSPKERALQTAMLVSEQLSEGERCKLEVAHSLAGGFDSSGAFALLSGLEAGAPVLLVGHEPDFSRVVHELTGANIDLKKGGIAVVRLEGATGQLLMLVRPRELALIADDESSASERPKN